MTAPTLVDSATGYDSAGGTSSTRTATLSGTPLLTDILIGYASCFENPATLSWPAGWTVVQTATSVSISSHSLAIATGLTTASTTVTASLVARKFSVMVAQVRGGDYAAIVSALTTDAAGGASKTFPSVTPAARDALLLAFGYGRNAQGVTVPPASYTERINLVSNDGGVSVRHNLYSQAVTPASGSYAPGITYAAGLNDWGGAQVALVQSYPTPGMWLDFLRDGFATTGMSTSPRLVRMLPQGASGVSDDITSDVISIQIDRVADVNGGTPIGSMVVTTKNTGGKYNPDNGSSSVYGNIDPGTPVWFGCNADLTLSGTGQTIYGRFAGYSRTVAPIPAAGATDAPTAEWVFDDAMARYRDAKARVAFSTTRTVATYRTAILTAIGETRTSLATEADTLPATGSVGVGTTILSGARWRRWLPPTTVAPDSLATAREQVRKKPVVTALAVLEDLNKAVGSRHFIAPADTKEDWYSYTTRNRQYKLGAAADAALTAMVTATSGYVHSNDGIVNAIAVEARPFRIAPQKVVVWEYQAVPFAIDAGSSKTIVADFGDMVYDATLTVASTNSLTTAALTAYGDGAGIALSSTGPDTVTALYVEGRPVTRLDVVVVEKSDAASKLAHGEMQGPNVSSDLITSEGLAEGIASYHIWASKSPRKTPAVTIINNPATLLPLDLHDVVTLTIPQLDVSAKRFEIVGIHETWTHAASASLALVAFTLDLRQTPNSSALSLFTIGSSTLGGSDGLAP